MFRTAGYYIPDNRTIYSLILDIQATWGPTKVLTCVGFYESQLHYVIGIQEDISLGVTFWENYNTSNQTKT